MPDKIKEILRKDIKQSLLIGISISLTYYYAFYQYHQYKLKTFAAYLVFGSILGYLISTASELAHYILNKKFSGYEKSLYMHIIVEFSLSALIFSATAYSFQLIFSGFISFEYGIYIGIGVGIMSTLVFLSYYALDQQKKALRLEKENKKLAVMKERNRIARELHDSVSQNLFGLNLQLNTLKEILKEDKNEVIDIIDDSKRMVEEVQTEMRLMIYELRPDNLKNKDYFVAIEDLVKLYEKRYRIDISTYLQGDEDILSDKEQLVIYRVIQESLSNCVKHSKTDKIDLSLIISKDNILELKIKDYGQGFDPKEVENKEDSFGLKTMEERIKGISGDLKINSKIDEGTEVKASIDFRSSQSIS